MQQANIFSSMPSTSTSVPPLAVHLNMLINTLGEAPRDDVKFQVLKEISENIDELFGTSAYSSLIEGLICIFMRLLQETSPQFIAENNTLQLRKLMLELLFRLSSNDVVKSYGKSLQQILLRLIYLENEENALLIIKILTDHIKTFRPAFASELTSFFIQWKNAYTEMLRHTANESMFLQKPFSTSKRTIEESVVEALRTCYFTTPLTFSQPQQSDESVTPMLEKYTLIPKANQSVKVLAEMSVFLFVLIQMHRQHLLGEVLDLIPIFLRYINIKLPEHLKLEKNYNRELVDEFHNSQVRALSFIGYTAKQAQIATVISEHTKSITDAILMLIDSFHPEVIIQRRELLMSLKYLFQSEFKTNFITLIPKMCDEKALLGNSFTSQDQLRNQSYSLLADILHHVRMNIPHLLKHIFFLCSRCLHDHQLLPYVQTMYGKLMMNLIEPLIIQSKENGTEIQRLILCNSINSFLRKAKLIANYHLPLIKEKYNKSNIIQPQQQYQSQQIKSTIEQKNLQSPSKTIAITEGQQTQETEITGGGGGQKQEKSSSSIETNRATFWQDPTSPLSLNDCKNLVRFIIQPIKMMVIALKEIGIEQEPQVDSTVERCLLELFPNGLICLDIFIIGSNLMQGGGLGNVYQHKISSNVRSKEEKETLDAFIAIYTNMRSSSFERVLEQHIEFLIERISINPILQNICSTFLTNPATMNKTGQILVKYLLTKLPDLGANNERATLYLKLFKLVFHAISCSSNNSDCDTILKPFLHQIIKQSMQYALEARESTNYFLLLRALFRSIGSGTHEQMYHQFLPLLPSILQQLNRLQNGSHLQSIHELFVELCLTVPVRLSSLLPYLPLLMDPLVCALNGSPTLVQQGLRTLELCVDNLQPEYFYDHMQPVRASLMKGLWHCVSHGDSHSSLTAFRILGKFGGSNRKILLDAQNIQDFNKINKNEEKLPKIILPFNKIQIENNNEELVNNEELIQCTVDLNQIVNSACKILRNQTTTTSNSYNQLAAANLLKFVLLKIFSIEKSSIKNSSQFVDNISNKIDEKSTKMYIICSDSNSRELTINALKGIFICVFNVETREKFLEFFKIVIKYLTISGIFEGNDRKDHSSMDSFVLIDVIAQTLSDPCKDYCHAAILALRIIIDTLNIIYEQNVEKICQFPLFEYLFEKITLLCYSCEWFSKLGGCTALRLIIEYYPPLLVQKYCIKIVEACIQMISDLSNELSSGALDYSSKTIDLLLNVCFPNNSNSIVSIDLLNQFVSKLINFIDDPDYILRKEIFRIICSLSTRTNLALYSILKNFKESLRTKILESIREFVTISEKSKIAGIDLFIFCSKIDEFNIDIPLYECMIFSKSLLKICFHIIEENSSNGFSDERRNEATLRDIALKALILLYFNIASYSKSIISSIQIPKFLHHQKQQQILLEQIFQTIFENAIIMKNGNKLKEEACECIGKDVLILIDASLSSNNINIVDVECVSNALQFFTHVNYLDQQLLQKLFLFYSECLSIFTTKQNITWQNDYFSYLSKFSSDFYPITILTKEIFNNDSATNFLVLLTSMEDATNFRLCIADNLSTLQQFTDELLEQNNNDIFSPNSNENDLSNLNNNKKFMLNFLRFLSTFFEKHNLLNDSNDFSNNYIQLWNDIIFSIRQLWLSENFQNGHSVGQIFPDEEAANLLSALPQEEEETFFIPPKILDENKFDVPIYCARIILTKLKFLLALQTTVENSEILSSEDEIIDLLYDLTFAFVRNYASDFLFLQQFIEEEIVPKISLSLRRATFFKVINLLKSDPKNGHSMHLVRFMQYIVAPSFSFAFDNYDIDLVVGGDPLPQISDSPSTSMIDDDQKHSQQNNIVLILCREVIQKATSDRTSLSHTLVIVMYLFCSLFVQKCSTHIYDASKKQQGNKQELGNLRPFMLFGWPSLQQSFRGDLTEKYAGLFLIANIVDKFLINRTIILQVLNSLIQAYQQDNKEMVRKSLDILIPAVTRRMTDGYSQLKALIKKVMIEETKQYGLQIIHCLQIIIRQYKVFYYVRHSMSQLILSSIQKLMSIQIGLETKRLLLEFCEVVIKWEQDRQQQLNLTNNSNCKTEHVVVELGDDNDDVQQQSQQPSTSSNIDAEPSIPLPPDSNKEMDKNFIDTVIMFLFRMATSTDQFSTSSGGGSSALEQINTLKPNIFGNVVTIRTNLFEKQLQLPNPEQFSTANETAINQQLQLVNITLDVLSNIIPHLSQQLLVDLFRPLQRSLICCMSYSNSQQILRSTYNILGKLLDKTTKNNAAAMTLPPGLNDFDLLNQHISRCIHDAFNNYACSLTASPPMTVITLLRLMHSAQSNYLETVCLGSFVKLLQRLVREYVATNFTYSATTAITPIQQHDLQAQKLIGDLLSICLELLCSRTCYFNTEAQKTIVQFVIIPLIEKGAADKLIENVIKIATEILTSEVQLISESFQQQLQQITSTPQPNIKIQSLGAQVLIKLFSTLESRLTTNFELKNLFLNAIILLYENSSSLMLSSSEGLLNIEIILPAFYWGLCCVDKELRKRFFTIHQRLFPPNLFARLIYIFTNERWDLLNSSTTNSSSIIAHLINLLLNADKSTTNSNLLLKLKNCSIFCPLLINGGINEEKKEEKIEGRIEGRNREDDEKIIEKMSLDVETIDLVNVGEDEEEDEIQMDTITIEDDKGRRKNKEGGEDEAMDVDDKEDNNSQLNKIFDEIQESLCISNDEQLTPSTICTEWIENFVDLLYIDPLLCQQTFIKLFTSIWSNLNENEREKICSFITPFLTSSAFCIPPSTTKNGRIKKEDNHFEEEENFVVSTILKALIKCKKPEIEIDPVVLSYVGSNFKCWHIALLKLEKIAISKKALISNIGGEITTSAWNAATNLTEEKLVIYF
ncbi:unnamed protein product [Meloidogyne enterolobii]|uniref:Uncharacterized protein n=1 Tax=Meloidogyne enterolobii TaxID=390850 RepID=A0ACB1A4U5_MELEN